MNGLSREKVEEQLRDLQRRYLADLPGRLGQVRLQPDAWRDAESCAAGLSAIVKLGHSLAGSGTTFGLPAVTHLGRELEELAQQMHEQVTDGSLPSEADRSRLEDCLQRLDAAAEGAPRDFVRTRRRSTRSAVGAATAVAVLDDDTILGEALRSQLGAFGYEVDVCHDRAEFLKALKQKSYAALLIDLALAEGPRAGMEIVREIQAERRPPVLFMSAFGDLDARIHAHRFGGQAFFDKPLNMVSVAARLDQVIGRTVADPFRVLLVDDEADVAAYHRLILEQAGIAVDVITDPRLILEAADRFRPELILMDLVMEPFDGIQVARALAQHDQLFVIPVVFLSSQSDRAQKFQAFAAGGENYLTKPIAAAELIGAVKTRLERARQTALLLRQDPLTGLLNHGEVFEHLRYAVQGAASDTFPLSVMFIDLDHFKSVNDTYGHALGDQVLQSLARLIRECAPGAGGRYGGEEFVIVLPGLDAPAALGLADDLRERFAELSFHPAAAVGPLHCTFSAGLASAHEAGCNPVDLIAAADHAMYRAKQAGRNRCVAAAD